jgi:hypothetical protein
VTTTPRDPAVFSPDTIRRGHRSQDMDDKWHAFVEDQRLYLHRSWTGMGVYEAQFAPEVSGGGESSAR